MPQLPISQGELFYESVDLTCPWVDRPEAVLFHHGLGATADIWTEWLPSLIDRYLIVRFDMRGLGRSRLPHKEYEWTLDGLAEDVFTLADAMKLESFHFVGESIGATIGLRAATMQPRRFRSLTVSNGAHIGASIKNVDAWRQIIDETGMEGWSRHMMPYRFFDERPTGEKRRWYERNQAANDSDCMLSALAVLVDTDLSAPLRNLDVPVLLMHPDSSPFIPASIMVDLYALLPDSELQIFAHARHGLPYSHARECASVYRDFLDRRFG